MNDVLWIPKISDEKLKALSDRIKVVSRFKDSQALYFVKVMNPKKVEYTWMPDPDYEAVGLTLLTEITIYYPYSIEGFYKPSMATVLAQIPPEFEDEVIAYEIVEDDEYLSAFNAHLDVVYAGYNLVIARLYK